MNLQGRDFLTLKDFTPDEIGYLLDLSAELKDKKKKGIPVDVLRGKNVALIFEKTSTRTRCAFEVAAHDLGMGTVPRSERRRVSVIQPECWRECMRESNIAGSVRRSWRNWRSIPRFRYGTA